MCVCVCVPTGGALDDRMINEIKGCVALVEANMGKKFGDGENPLLFSVRSGAAVRHTTQHTHTHA